MTGTQHSSAWIIMTIVVWTGLVVAGARTLHPQQKAFKVKCNRSYRSARERVL